VLLLRLFIGMVRMREACFIGIFLMARRQYEDVDDEEYNKKNKSKYIEIES
jgi:hypothetical protein